MSGYKLVNVAATEILPQRTVLRVTLSKVSSIALTDTQFTNEVNRIYEAVIASRFSPTSPDPAIKDGKPAVIDVRLLQSWTLADFASTLESIAGFWVTVSQIEKLTDSKAAVSSGNEGAIDRETQKEKQAIANDTSGIFGEIGKLLGIAKHVAIVVVIVAVVAGAIVYHKEIAAGLKRIR